MDSEQRTVTIPTTRQSEKPKLPRQVVSFLFYKVDPAWYQLPEHDRHDAGTAFQRVIDSCRQELKIFTYSTMGLKTDSDLLIWRVGETLEQFAAMSAVVAQTGFGRYLRLTQSYLSMTRRSIYVDKLDPAHQDARLYIVPAQEKYLFVYPFVKARNWYRLSQEERQRLMDEHIRVGNKYKSVKLHTTYSYGLDDQEFVVAFETDQPGDFLDLVMELRLTEASGYTQRDTPIFSCVRQDVPTLLQSFGAAA